MPRRCAVWLDHSKAWIVTFTPEGEAKVEKLESGIKAVHKSTGGARAGTPYLHGSAARSTEAGKRAHCVAKFYESIIAKVREQSRILLIGPGLARQELGRAIDDLPGTAKPRVSILPAEKMTERQLIALARKELEISSTP